MFVAHILEMPLGTIGFLVLFVTFIDQTCVAQILIMPLVLLELTLLFNHMIFTVLYKQLITCLNNRVILKIIRNASL